MTFPKYRTMVNIHFQCSIHVRYCNFQNTCTFILCGVSGDCPRIPVRQEKWSRKGSLYKKCRRKISRSLLQTKTPHRLSLTGAGLTTSIKSERKLSAYFFFLDFNAAPTDKPDKAERAKTATGTDEPVFGLAVCASLPLVDDAVVSVDVSDAAAVVVLVKEAETDVSVPVEDVVVDAAVEVEADGTVDWVTEGVVDEVVEDVVVEVEEDVVVDVVDVVVVVVVVVVVEVVGGGVMLLNVS